MPASDDTFFGRWSRRKTAVRQGETLPPEAPAPLVPPQAAAAPAPEAAPPRATAMPTVEPARQPLTPAAVPPAEAPLPTLADAQQLTPASDFSAFVQPQVQPEVRNAALKKLFADPHFNVMDGLDTYIDDYNTPDPLPAGMLRQLVQSEMLGLFAPAPAPQAPASACEEPDPALAAPPEPTELAETESTAAATSTDATPAIARHEDADLQLQPDDAAGRPGADPGAAAHARGQH